MDLRYFTDTFLPADSGLAVILGITWLVIIPYLFLFPNNALHQRYIATKQRRAITKTKLKLSWQLQPEKVRNGLLKKFKSKSNMSLSIDENIDVPLPIWRIPASSMVVVALVNCKSGGRAGGAVLKSLRRVLGTAQVFDLAETSHVEAVLKSFRGTYRLLVCGGDGTIGWIQGAASAIWPTNPPAMGILPLGTGNDLARSYGWSGGVSLQDVTDSAIAEFVCDVARAKIVPLDRWRVTLRKTQQKSRKDNGTTSSQNSSMATMPIDDNEYTEVKTMCNYFSYGIDAEIGLKFHQEREQFPERFTSQSSNKLKYALYGFQASFDGKPLDDCCLVRTDGRDEPLPVEKEWKACIISNIPCYHGGANFWEGGFLTNLVDDTSLTEDEKLASTKVSMHDRKLEVMGLAGCFHIGLCDIAADQAMRLAQPRRVNVEVRKPDVSMQIDGEPFRFGPGTISFEHRDQYPMLFRPTSR